MSDSSWAQRRLFHTFIYPGRTFAKHGGLCSHWLAPWCQCVTQTELQQSCEWNKNSSCWWHSGRNTFQEQLKISEWDGWPTPKHECLSLALEIVKCEGMFKDFSNSWVRALWHFWASCIRSENGFKIQSGWHQGRKVARKVGKMARN